MTQKINLNFSKSDKGACGLVAISVVCVRANRLNSEEHAWFLILGIESFKHNLSCNFYSARKDVEESVHR
jgi:hypothetical protein